MIAMILILALPANAVGKAAAGAGVTRLVF
jgi:hypothetical protein